MHRRIPVLALLTAFGLAACSPDDVVAPVKAPVKALSSVQLSGRAARESRHIVLLNATAVPADFATRVKALGGRVRSADSDAGFAVVTGLTDAAAANLASFGSVQPDVVVKLDDPKAIARADATALRNPSTASATNPAGAILLSWQWNMALIQAPAAWAVGKLGSSRVTVAILDTGIDYDSFDLTGLVDLSRSTSFMDTFVGNPDDPTTPEYDPDPVIPADDEIIGTDPLFAGRNLVADLNGHGTNVASQVSSGAFAFAGVTSKTTLIGVKVLGANGVGDLGDILNGVIWAVNHGADVANLSLGGSFPKRGNGQVIAAINRVFNYAHRKGVTVVVAAGNEGTDLKHNGGEFASFCDADRVICVSAVGPVTPTSNPDEPAFYSNFGKGSVDVAGPGGNGSLTTPPLQLPIWPWGRTRFSFVWSLCPKQEIAIALDPTATNPDNGKYALAGCQDGFSINGFVGTSQATPHVTGLAALLLAEHGRWDPDRIKQHIQRTGDPIPRSFGRSRINVKTALGI
jgi:subtilisin family serine protease